MERKPKMIRGDIMSRVLKLYVAAVIISLAVIGRLVYVQFFSGEIARNAERLDRKIFRVETLKAHRGAIRARTGEPLATSIFRSTIQFDFGAEGFDNEQRFLNDVDTLSQRLAEFFGDKSAREYRDAFVSYRNRHNVPTITDKRVQLYSGLERGFHAMMGHELEEVVKDTVRKRNHRPIRMFRDVDFNEWLYLRTLPILGGRAVTYTRDEHDDRIYPCGNIARSIVGRLDENGVGLNGLEKVFDKELQGENGLEWQQHIAYSFWTRVDKPASSYRDKDSVRRNAENKAPVDGIDVITTIDVDIQEVADRLLRERVSSQNAFWGTTMVMEVKTGDLVAVANISRDKNGRLVENYNHGFRSRTEPGSTFKLASMLALLDDAGVPITKTYDANHGKNVFIQTGTRHPVRVRDSGDDGGVIDMKEALAQSSNTWFAQAVYEAYRNDPDRFINYLRRLHLDTTVCVTLPEIGEMKPNFLHPKRRNWTRHESLIKISFGQGGMEVTPLQILTLYNAVANNGRMVAPRLVTELRENGRTVKEFPVTTLESSICSPSTLALVRESLEEAALTGTGKNLFGEGKTPFRAGLKTGTAEYAQNGILYTDGYFVASMATYFPADNPKYTIMTSIHTKRGRGYHMGTSLAGPVNRELAMFIYNRDNDRPAEEVLDSQRHYPTSVKGGDPEQVRKVAGRLARGSEIDRHTAWGRAKVDSAAMVSIVPSVDDGTMPDVAGMGLKDALFMLENRGLKVSVTGKGAVSSQSIRPGTQIQKGMAVHIVLK